MNQLGRNDIKTVEKVKKVKGQKDKEKMIIHQGLRNDLNRLALKK